MKRTVLWKNPGYKASKALTGTQRATYLIVGAGITGLMTAHFLIQQRVRPEDISIVEKDVVGSGSTGRSAGMLMLEPETRDNLWWNDFIEKYGKSNAQAYRAAHREALKTVRTLIQTQSIACDLQTEDLLLLAKTPGAIQALRNDMAARRSFRERAAALTGTSLAQELAIDGFIFAERTIAGISVNPLALAQGIAGYLRGKGVRIYEHSPLIRVSRKTAYVEHGTISFATLFRTTGVDTPGRYLQKFITTIAVTTPLSRATLRRLRLDDKDMFLDEAGARSYHYAKVTADNRFLIGYGDLQHAGDSATVPLHEPHLRDIKRFLARAFPGIPLPLDYAWSGSYALSKSGLPYIRIAKDDISINGAGIQLGSIVAADYAVSKMFHMKHALDRLLAS